MGDGSTLGLGRGVSVGGNQIIVDVALDAAVGISVGRGVVSGEEHAVTNTIPIKRIIFIQLTFSSDLIS